MGTEKQNRLKAEWPKKCGCGRNYCGLECWKLLPRVGEMKDAFATLELRNCPCGSTLGVLVEIHDLSKE